MQETLRAKINAALLRSEVPAQKIASMLALFDRSNDDDRAEIVAALTLEICAREKIASMKSQAMGVGLSNATSPKKSSGGL